MSDSRIRSKARAGDRVAALRERLRAGQLTPCRLCFAAYCGDKDAVTTLELKVKPDSDPALILESERPLTDTKHLNSSSRLYIPWHCGPWVEGFRSAMPKDFVPLRAALAGACWKIKQDLVALMPGLDPADRDAQPVCGATLKEWLKIRHPEAAWLTMYPNIRSPNDRAEVVLLAEEWLKAQPFLEHSTDDPVDARARASEIVHKLKAKAMDAVYRSTDAAWLWAGPTSIWDATADPVDGLVNLATRPSSETHSHESLRATISKRLIAWALDGGP